MALEHLPSGVKTRLAPLGAGLPLARTEALLKSSQLEVVRVVLQQGKTMREHKAPGEITVLCLEGRLALSTPQVRHEMESGDFLHLEAGVPHALEGLTDTSALVTMVIHPSV
ncbi:cupin domain-containing protein [Curvibacter sp. APW13]|uniref:cupin domain-containing protein n=1 Tax=Curvibacter sp. APW13 TaxID=3077236 RepID=UPI0028DDD210|nr:cupin domain-containing protein [Curvibacter sp. APW13]MDT8989821.1 cupin domain-containing protein [Curvibacter sp. APW13]